MTLEHCHLLNGPPARRALRTEDLVDFCVELHVFWVNYHSEASLTDHSLWVRAGEADDMSDVSLCFSTALLSPRGTSPQWAPRPLRSCWSDGALSPPSSLAASACLLCLLSDGLLFGCPLCTSSSCSTPAPLQAWSQPWLPLLVAQGYAVLSGCTYSCPQLCR